MSLGLGLLSGQIAPGRPKDWEPVYADLVDLAVHAETKGFDSVWTTEHHFVDDGYMPSLLVVSAALAARTTTLEIGTGVILAPLHHPLRLAEDAATVQLLSSGRLLLGLGLGWADIEFEAFGAPMQRRGVAMDEILQILPLAWAGDPFTWSGDQYSFPTIGVRPTPSARIPIVLGGTVDAAVQRAARLADGFFSNASPDRFAHQVAVGLAEMERIGRDPGTFTWIYYAVVFPTENRAEALPHIWHQRWKYSDMNDSAARAGPVATAPLPSDQQAAAASEQLVTGSGDEIVAHLHAVRDRVDVPVRFVARSHFTTLDRARQIEVVDRLAEDVLPYV